MNSKGLSPIVASVLLIGISVSATVSAAAFLNDLQKEFQENQEDQIVNERQRENSDLNMEYVYNSTDSYIITRIRNTGSITLPIKDSGEKLLTVTTGGRPIGGDGTGWIFIDSELQTNQDVSLNPQQTLEINTTIEYPSIDSEKFISVSGPYGTADTHSCYNSGVSSC